MVGEGCCGARGRPTGTNGVGLFCDKRASPKCQSNGRTGAFQAAPPDLVRRPDIEQLRPCDAASSHAKAPWNSIAPEDADIVPLIGEIVLDRHRPVHVGRRPASLKVLGGEPAIRLSFSELAWTWSLMGSARIGYFIGPGILIPSGFLKINRASRSLSIIPRTSARRSRRGSDNFTEQRVKVPSSRASMAFDHFRKSTLAGRQARATILRSPIYKY